MKKSIINSLAIGLFMTSICSIPCALPSAEVEEIEVISQETKTVTFLGIETSRISHALRKHIDLPEGVGLTVSHIATDSGASNTDLQQYDILHKVDDQIIVNQEQLRTYIQSKKAGDTVNLAILRKGKKIQIPVELGKREVSENRKFGNHWPFQNPMPNSFPQNGGNWNFNFDSEEFQDRIEEFSKRAAEFGNRAMQFIPEVMIEQEKDDGSKRITSLGRGPLRVKIRKNDLVAELTHEDGKKSYLIKEVNGEEETILYEGDDPDEEALKNLSPESRVLIDELNSSESFDWKNIDKVMNEEIRIIINTGEDEASLSSDSNQVEA